MAIDLFVRLWAVPGHEHLLIQYEDQVLRLLGAHGGRVVQRVRALDPSDGPFEAHVLEFPSESALDAYLADPARLALSELREHAIARTELQRVGIVAG